MTPTPPPDNARARAIYELGAGTICASRIDARFSYCTYVPPHLGQPGARPLQLVVVVHGTGRAFTEDRDAFSGFAHWNDCIVLCPLFPASVLGDGNRSGYKFLAEGDIRYDRVLLGMVDEVAARFGCDFTRFALAGYSGGAQFVNRFALLYAERLWAISIGAPGSVTLLDPQRDWWVGTRGMAQRFGRTLDLEALRHVPVHMVVGRADLETWEITHEPGGLYYMAGANSAGRTRPERLETLRRSFEAAGVRVTFDLLENVAHEGNKCVGVVTEFLAQELAGMRGVQGT